MMPCDDLTSKYASLRAAKGLPGRNMGLDRGGGSWHNFLSSHQASGLAFPSPVPNRDKVLRSTVTHSSHPKACSCSRVMRSL